MAETEKKYVIVVNKTLPNGLLVNAAAVLATNIGRIAGEDLIGHSVEDASGEEHEGITRVPIAILASNSDGIAGLKKKAASENGLYLVGFTSTAQKATRYEDYEQRMAMLESDELEYVGLGIYGDADAVKKLTGSMPLLR